MDDDGEPIIIEIDKSNYFHWKYHRGQWTEGHWVFGAIERESGRCLMTEVPDRRFEILEPIIRCWILPSSRIISDGWHFHDLLNKLDFGVYDHDIDVHLRNFVDPADRTSQVFFTSYLSEFLWRNKYGN